MKILLDECVTKHLKPRFSGHEVFTVREMNWSGIKNGKLMALCVAHNFDILLTIDKNLQYQQNLDRFPVCIVVLNCVSSKLEELIPLLSIFNERVGTFLPHNVHIIDK